MATYLRPSLYPSISPYAGALKLVDGYIYRVTPGKERVQHMRERYRARQQRSHRLPIAEADATVQPDANPGPVTYATIGPRDRRELRAAASGDAEGADAGVQPTP
jgi:hypothetical protein